MAIGTSDGEYFETKVDQLVASAQVSQSPAEPAGAFLEEGSYPSSGANQEKRFLPEEYPMDTGQAADIPLGGVRKHIMDVENTVRGFRDLIGDRPKPLAPPEMTPEEIEHIERTPGRRIS